MKIINFFNEEINVPVDDKDLDKVMMEIEKLYDIPIQNQRLDHLNGKIVLSILENDSFDDLNKKMPESLNELGVSDKEYNIALNFLQSNGFSHEIKDIEEHLFPYLHREVPRTCQFRGIVKNGLESTNDYVNMIPDNQKDIILRNLEDYIVVFLEDESGANNE